MGQMRKRHVTATFKVHLKKGDEVLVLAGRSNGERGKVLNVDPQRERATVDGVNMITKHQKPMGQAQQGGRIEKPAPVHVSNLMVCCPGCAKPTRVIHKEEAGKKVRACKHCGATLDAAK